jgi:TetR/AcrR family transcriptional regulator, regulator of autoinduction and epiphytic fitness
VVKSVATRSYASPLRREQAARTRSAVLDAARDLFLTQGYGRTTIAVIARSAGVSAETVYAGFGSKRAVLSALLDVAIAGDDEPVAILDRPWVAQIRSTPRIRARLRILARKGARMLERRAPIDALLRTAAEADPAVASIRDEAIAQRLAGQRALLRLVIADDGDRLRPGLTEAGAGDILYALGSPETWQALVVDRGWSPDAFRDWYAESLERLLLR